jgi:hypothetical protein
LWLDKGKKYWGKENINEEEIRGDFISFVWLGNTD